MMLAEYSSLTSQLNKLALLIFYFFYYTLVNKPSVLHYLLLSYTLKFVGTSPLQSGEKIAF